MALDDITRKSKILVNIQYTKTPTDHENRLNAMYGDVYDITSTPEVRLQDPVYDALTLSINPFFEENDIYVQAIEDRTLDKDTYYELLTKHVLLG